MIPDGATHTHEFYGVTHFFKRKEHQHLNQVSEEWQTRVAWDFWNGYKWIDAGPGLRTDKFKKLENENARN